MYTHKPLIRIGRDLVTDCYKASLEFEYVNGKNARYTSDEK